MSGRFPGSPDLDRYWDNLAAGRDLVTEVPAHRWDWRSLCENIPRISRAGTDGAASSTTSTSSTRSSSASPRPRPR
ncbi:beta-ketoacyl synthase N-terminal-like domain-containing protein [Phytohabitans flavus]